MITVVEAINNLKYNIKEAFIQLLEPIVVGLKQKINTLMMYVYLVYYTQHIRHSRTYMLTEVIKELKCSQLDT